MRRSFDLVAGEQAGQISVTARAGELVAEAEITVNEAGGDGLVINEANVDMAGDEDQEFIEIYNGSAAAVPLAGISLELVNGNGGQEYYTAQLADAGAELAAGAYLVVGDAPVPVPPGTLFIALPEGHGGHQIQNGDPDGMRIIDAEGGAIDGVAYAGPMEGVGEGAGSAPKDPNDDGGETIGRCPDGADTDDNAADFRLLPRATPGAPNACE